jgi:mannose-6-phosphate isomerase-like protein (cupin superfamily)
MNESSLYKLAELSRDHLRTTRFVSNADFKLAETFANDLDSVVLSELPVQTIKERPVNGLRHAPDVLRTNVPDNLLELSQAARNAFDHVRWTEFYEEDSWSKSFLDEFANGEGIGPDGRLFHRNIILGLFILGPETTYPEHAHPAEEFYIVLTGNPQFKVGVNSEFKPMRSGEVILHHSDISHSIKSSSAPFYAIFGWRGEIHERSWYRNNMADLNESKKHPTIRKS